MLLEINYFRYVYNISSCYIYFILFNYIIITI
jgi:translation initiation factor 3 subunit M